MHTAGALGLGGWRRGSDYIILVTALLARGGSGRRRHRRARPLAAGCATLGHGRTLVQVAAFLRIAAACLAALLPSRT